MRATTDPKVYSDALNVLCCTVKNVKPIEKQILKLLVPRWACKNVSHRVRNHFNGKTTIFRWGLHNYLKVFHIEFKNSGFIINWYNTKLNTRILEVGTSPLLSSLCFKIRKRKGYIFTAQKSSTFLVFTIAWYLRSENNLVRKSVFSRLRSSILEQ